MSELRDCREQVGAALCTRDYYRARQAVVDLLEANASGRVLRPIARLGQPGRFSPWGMAEMLRVGEIGGELRC